jgi:hypothetical protein
LSEDAAAVVALRGEGARACNGAEQGGGRGNVGGHGKEGHGQGGMARYLVRKAWETIAAHVRHLQIGWYERALPGKMQNACVLVPLKRLCEL